MLSELTTYAKKIIEAVEALEKQKEDYAKERNNSKREIIKDRIRNIQGLIENISQKITQEIEGKISDNKVEDIQSKTFKGLSSSDKKEFIENIELDIESLNRFLRDQKKKNVKIAGLKKEDYKIYAPNEWGRIANKYMKSTADKLVDKYPKFFESLTESFDKVNMPFLSRTYVSLMLFCALLSIPIAFAFFFIINLAFNFGIAFVIVITILAPFLTFAGFYFYPASLQGDRQRKISQELPFALVHMSAVAGSGARPISMFELLVESEEYPELKKEIRKVLNYVNLFGYNLTTALTNVAKSTPAQDLKNLFNGLVSTVESGGDLKGYLNQKADEALNSYKLYRKKKVDALGTLSEIYTAILIAAPLLLIVSLAIMNNVGGALGGVSIATLAYISVLVMLPILNVIYMFFVNVSQK